jgi:hypothetical protein
VAERTGESSMTEAQIVAMIATILELQGEGELSAAQITLRYQENLKFARAVKKNDLTLVNDSVEDLDRAVRVLGKMQRGKD